MIRIMLIATLLLAGCSSTIDTPIIVEPTRQVYIDPALLVPCEKPEPMTTMNQGKLLEYSIKEARKLILCGKSQETLASLICLAINCQPDQPQNDQ